MTPNLVKKAQRSCYPEYLAKTCNGQRNLSKAEALSFDTEGIYSYKDSSGLDRWIKAKQPKEPTDKIYRCTPGFITGETSTKYLLKMVTCGRDWCPDCGKLGSITHTRRVTSNFSRANEILERFGSLQYLIITIPAQIRAFFNSKESLNDFRTYWRRKLKREGYNCGVMRYHWAGEDGYKYAPHINILAPGAFIPKNKLAKWRAELSVWFQNYCKSANLPKSNIYCSYTKDPNKAKHWVNYVFRATQTFFNKWSADTIKGYRNTSPFGTWEKKEKDYTEEGRALKGFYQNTETGELEKIQWKMQYSQKRNCLVPQLSRLEHISLESCTLLGRAFWIRDRILAPPPDSTAKIRIKSGVDSFNFTE